LSWQSGFAGIYAGLAPTILKVATAQGTRFGVFQVLPAEYRKTPLGAAACGAFAGGVSVILFQGIDVIKSRMQGLDGSKYRSSMHWYASAAPCGPACCRPLPAAHT
jgi:solute carrier family 25 citrate transporter 1